MKPTKEPSPTALRQLAALRTVGAHAEEPLSLPLVLLVELVALRLRVMKAAPIATTAEQLMADELTNIGVELDATEYASAAALAELIATSTEGTVSRFVDSLRPALQPKKRKRRPLRTLQQITRRLQEIPEDLANGDITAPQARAEVYTLQTLLVVMKATAPRQLPLPATVPELSASAEPTPPQLQFPADDYRSMPDLGHE